jgi:microcystin-dependent protein
MADPYIGQISLFAGDFPPSGYVLCDGELLPIAQYTALFTVLGIVFGGDGEVTFGVPDLKSRAPMQWGNGPGLTSRTLGETGGVDSVALTPSQNGVHSHPMRAGAVATSNVPAADVGIGNALLFAPPSSPEVVMHALSIEEAGSGAPHENRQPYLAVNFIIAVAGEFPS